LNDNNKEIILGDEAKDYLKGCLREGHTLAQCILQKIYLDNGFITTVLPSYVNDKLYNDFHIGGKLTVNPEDIKDGINYKIMPLPNMNTYLAAVIKAFLQEEAGNICIIENALAKPCDPWITMADIKIIFYKEEVYHFLINKNLTDNMIKETILFAESIPIFIGVLATIPQEELSLFINKENYELSFEELNIIVDGIKRIFVAAYDGEGYLIWNK
jgi:hypothetical protein